MADPTPAETEPDGHRCTSLAAVVVRCARPAGHDWRHRHDGGRADWTDDGAAALEPVAADDDPEETP